MKTLPPLLMLLLLTFTASAVPIQVVYTDAVGTGFFDPGTRTPTATNPGKTLGEKRRIAFEYALSRWSAQITGTVPISVEAGWSSRAPSGGSIPLASASPKHFFFQSVAGTFPRANTFYPGSLADQLSGQDLVQSGSTVDISVDCNSYVDDVTTDGFSFNYDTDPTGSTSSSFVGVVLHEIGHGLGFISGLDEVAGDYPSGHPNVWDSFMANGAGTQFTTMSNAGRATLATSDNVFFDGPVTRLYNNDKAAKLHAPATFKSGSSLHHLDETKYSTLENVNELMTPNLSYPTQLFGPIVTSILRDMGYVMADTRAPSQSIRSPLPGKAYTSAALAAAGVYGLTTDEAAAGNNNAVGLLRSLIALYNGSTGKWFNWGTELFDSPTFIYAPHTTNAPINALFPIATGPHTWRATLPSGLSDGAYQLHVTSVDQNDQGSAFIHVDFTIDNVAPATVIEPWNDGDSVVDLRDLAILATDATTVTCQLHRTVSGTLYYWSGTAWSTSVANLPASLSGGRWRIDAASPGRANLLPSQPVEIYATATDAAANTSTVHLSVFRTAADTSPPEATVDYPVSGSVLTAPYLSGLSGIARDLQTGVSSATLTFTRFLPGGDYKFWNGTAWGDTAVNLPVHLDNVNGTWTAPNGWNLPNGTDLPNGSYTVQITVANGESPASVVGGTSSFSVDFHPVYKWTGRTLRDNIVGNDSSLWDTAENWSPYGVPGENDFVEIGIDSVQSSIDRTVYGLRLGGDATVLGNFVVNITGPSSSWFDGTVTGTLHILTGAALNIDTSYTPYLSSGTILNSGTLTITGDLTFDNGGKLLGHNSAINNSGSLIINRTGLVFQNAGVPPVITNTGTFRKSVAGGTSLVNWQLDNNGTVQSDSGALSFNIGSTEAGSSGVFFSADSAARIEFSGGGHVLKTGARFTGPGRGRLSTGSLRLDGAVSAGVAGTPAGGFEETGDASVMNGPGSLSVLGGSGTFAWSDGTISTIVTIAPGATLAVDTTATPYLNSGTLNLNGTTIITGDLTFDNGGKLLGHNSAVNNSGTFAITRTGLVFQNAGVPPIITNTGIFEKSVFGGTSLVNWQLDNNGTVQSNSGTLSFNIGSTEAGSSGVFFSADSAARIEFSGGGHVLKTGARFTGPGRGRLSAGSLRLDGPVSAGVAGSPAGGFEELGDATVMGGTGSLSVLGGSGNFAWSDGTISTTVTIAPGANLAVDTTATPYLNSGTLNLNGTTTITGDLTIDDGGKLLGHNSSVNNSGTLVINRTGTVFQNVGVPPVITNTGTFRKSVTGGTSLVNWQLDNNGTVQSDSGTLGFNLGSTEAGSSGVFFSADSAARIEFSGGGHVLKTGARFTGPGRGRLSAGSLRLDGPASTGIAGTPAGGFEELGDTTLMYGSGSLSVLGGGGTFAWNDGTISTSVTIAAGASLAVDTTATPYLSSGTLNLNGTTTITGDLTFDDGGKLVGHNSAVNNSGTFVINRTGTVFQNVGVPPVITNTGTFKKSVAGGTSLVNWQLDNNGTVQCDTGILSFNLGSTDVGSNGVFYSADSAARIEFSGSGHVLRTGARFTGPGRGRIIAGSLRLDGAVSTGIAGTPAGGFEELGDTTLMYGPGSLSVLGGGGTFAWNDGTISTTVTVAAGGNLAVDISAGPYLSSGILNNAGNGTLTGGGDLFYGHNSSFNNLSTGNLQILSSGEVFRNNGVVPLLTNAGILGLGSQPHIFSSGWNFAQTSSGTFDVKLAGTNAVTPQFDQVFTGSMDLAGKLRVTRIGGFQPALGDKFRLLNFSSATGAFSTYENLALGSGLKLVPVQTATYVELGVAGSGFSTWQTAQFGVDANNPSIAGPFANPDSDQGNNALEYAFNLNPKVAQGPIGWPNVSMIADPDDGLKHLAITFRRRLDDVDLSYKVRVSDSLTGGWDESGNQIQQVGAAVASGDGVTEMVTMRLAAPTRSASRKFLEVMVSGF